MANQMSFNIISLKTYWIRNIKKQINKTFSLHEINPFINQNKEQTHKLTYKNQYIKENNKWLETTEVKTLVHI